MLPKLHSLPFMLVFGAGLFATYPATAQSNSRTAAYASVGKSCNAETARFCPAIDPATPQPRNQAICLKSFRSSLSLGCRRAVDAARQ